jgi:hypothetical protein
MVLHEASLQVDEGRDPAARCRPDPAQGDPHGPCEGQDTRGASASSATWTVPRSKARHRRRSSPRSYPGRTSLTAATPPPRAFCEAADAPPAAARPRRTRSPRPRPLDSEQAAPSARVLHAVLRSWVPIPQQLRNLDSTAQKPRQGTADSHSGARSSTYGRVRRARKALERWRAQAVPCG